MPFEISPDFLPAKVGTYQRFADAMLRGCASSEPNDAPISCRDGKVRTCAMGALALGLGAEPVFQSISKIIHNNTEIDAMESAYINQYDIDIRSDNDSGTYTREQIAERIAAL